MYQYWRCLILNDQLSAFEIYLKISNPNVEYFFLVKCLISILVSIFIIIANANFLFIIYMWYDIQKYINESEIFCIVDLLLLLTLDIPVLEVRRYFMKEKQHTSKK